ncbi:hypothetical protein B0I37DRAFT_427831 [Chaetomium sp. MPI-CAGE-AT-0009]|nr:hypothetical protein B0I37DRAFT_427831 [Chaetomium sp. MPI-CAGE-AT-0009]
MRGLSENERPNNDNREADNTTGVGPSSRLDAEVGRQLTPRVVHPWAPVDDDQIFPWEYVTDESREWILYVEGSYGSDFRWCRVRPPPQESHCQAMFASSPFKKGIFYDPASPPLRPTYLAHRPNPTVIVPRNPEWFILPFFCIRGRSFFDLIESHGPFDPRGLLTDPREVHNLPQHELATRSALVAAMVYLCGQVRLGDRQCQRCRRRRITTTIPGDSIPVCATAGRYFHGVCTNCLAMGGTLTEMLERCSVSGRLSYEEYERLGRGVGDPGWEGRSPFIGDNARDLAFARNLLWRKALPPRPRRNPGTAPASRSTNQNLTAPDHGTNQRLNGSSQQPNGSS